MGILIRGADSTYRVENCFISEKSFLVPTKHNENLSPITFFKVIVFFFLLSIESYLQDLFKKF